MNNLPNAYDNLHNSEIRICTLRMKKLLFLMLLRVIFQNRWTSRYRKLNRTRALAQGCFNWKKSQNSIVAQALDSHESWCVWQWHIKTVVDLGPWSTNQKELSNLVENWWRIVEKCWWSFWENLENGGKFVMILENCNCDLQFSYD